MLEFWIAFEDPELGVQIPDGLVVLQVVDQLGNGRRERADLVDDRRDDRVDRGADDDQQTEEDDRHPGPAPHAPFGDHVDQRIEPDGQQHRDGDQDQGVPDGVQHQVADVGDQHPEAAEEAPVERRSSMRFLAASAWPVAAALAASALASGGRGGRLAGPDGALGHHPAGHRGDRRAQPAARAVRRLVAGVPVRPLRRLAGRAVAEVEFVQGVVERGIPFGSGRGCAGFRSPRRLGSRVLRDTIIRRRHGHRIGAARRLGGFARATPGRSGHAVRRDLRSRAGTR